MSSAMKVIVQDVGSPMAVEEEDVVYSFQEDLTPTAEAEAPKSGFFLCCAQLARPQRRTRNVALRSSHAGTKVVVVAPGAGVGVNMSVFKSLSRDQNFNVDIIGRSRTTYDRYPPMWPEGRPAPNLETFAQEQIVNRGVVPNAECLVFGSRGGQVVLPFLWNALGASVPPAVVINGGCAMDVPTQVRWPASAVTFNLLGGKDYFKRSFTSEQYVADAKNHVPSCNVTTAVLFVEEMEHMPHARLLDAVLRLAIQSVTSWKANGRVPLEQFQAILRALQKNGWSGRLLYTSGPGLWEDIAFTRNGVSQIGVASAPDAPVHGTKRPFTGTSPRPSVHPFPLPAHAQQVKKMGHQRPTLLTSRSVAGSQYKQLPNFHADQTQFRKQVGFASPRGQVLLPASVVRKRIASAPVQGAVVQQLMARR